MKDSSIKRTNRIQMRMNSFQEMSNTRWKQFSNIYANLLLHFPWSILVLSLLITIGLTSCFLFLFQIRPFDQNDFLIPQSTARRNALHIQSIFGNDTELRMHQQLNLYPGLDIIMKRKLVIKDGNWNHTNMLRHDILQEIHELNRQVQSILISNENHSKEYNYSSLCTKINGACIIDGNYILTEKFRQDLSHLLLPKSGYYFDASGANGIPEFMFGKNYHVTNSIPTTVDYDEDEYNEHNNSQSTIETTSEKIISYVPVFRLRYTLNTSTAEMRQLAMRWEREALHYLNNEYQSLLIEVLPSTSKAITDTIVQRAHEEGLYMSIMIVIFLILVCFFITIQGNLHTSVGYLSLCGILSFALSTGATFGILAICQIQIIEPMALLVFIVAIIDCMRISIVCGEYHRLIKDYLRTLTAPSSEIDLSKILPSIIESTHPYFMISTLIITLVYSILSLLSPMITTLLICLTLVLYIFVNYLVHATFFSSCLVITLKRVASRRHCLFCFRLSNDYHTKSKKQCTKFRLLKEKISSLFIKDSILKKFFSAILCLILIISIISSIWFCLSIDTRLFDDQFLPRESTSLRSYMKSQIDDFNIGPVVMFVIPETINYEDEHAKSMINSLLKQCQNELRTNNFKLLWLDHENVSYVMNGKESLEYRITPFSQNDLILFDQGNHSVITASRFYCQLISIKGDREDIRTMNNIYTFADQSSIPSVFPYSLLFSTYEALEQIRIEMYLLILLLIICTFISTFILFLSFQVSLFILAHILALLTGTLTCLYLFHNLTFNFANILWLFVVSILFLDTLIHSCYKPLNSKWKYNRILLSLVLSLLILYFIPIQAYVFQTIRNSLIYQSIICFILINVILPSCNYLFQSLNRNDEQMQKIQQPMITIIDGNQSLTNGMEIKTDIYEIHTDRKSSI